MKGYSLNLEREVLTNEYFRRVLYTTKNCQLVIMCLKPGEEIGEETHELDQFIKCEAGEGKSIIDGVEHALSEGFAVVVPAGSKHNIMNTSSNVHLKLYTVYAPPNHRDGVMHQNKAEADKDDEHFDGVVSDL